MVTPTGSQLVGQTGSCTALWALATAEPWKNQAAHRLPSSCHNTDLETARQTAFAYNLIVLSPLLPETPFAGQAILNCGKSFHSAGRIGT